MAARLALTSLVPDRRARHTTPDADRHPLDVGPSPGAFEVLYQRHWTPLVRLAFLMTGSRELAEDVVQDAFVGLQRAWSTVDLPPAYLRRSVVNGVRGQMRRQSTAERRFPLSVVEDVDADTEDPEDDRLWRLLGRLPDRQRHALVLRYYQDLAIEDVARLLDCPLGTAKSLIHRGLSRLQELVA